MPRSTRATPRQGTTPGPRRRATEPPPSVEPRVEEHSTAPRSLWRDFASPGSARRTTRTSSSGICITKAGKRGYQTLINETLRRDQRDAAPGAGTRGSGRCAPAGAEGGAATPAALRRRLNGAVPEAPARRRVRVRHGRRGRYRVTASSSSRRSAEAPTRTDPSPRRSPVQGIHVLATSITQMEIRRASSGVSVPRKRSSSSVALRGRTPNSGSWQYCSPNQNTR